MDDKTERKELRYDMLHDYAAQHRLDYNNLCRTVRAALRPAEPQGWQPIETAPKDGTPILAWNAEYGARETRSLTYTPGSPGFAEGSTDRWWQWDEPKNNWTMRWEPTHWMPLPAAPGIGGERE